MKKISLFILFFALTMQICATAALASVYSVTVDGIITNNTSNIIKKAVARAEKEGAKVLLIRLNTPGGVLEATRDIVQIINKSAVPVAVYVGPSGARAASAGMFITIAANYSIMCAGTNIGAAHPVNSTGEDIKGEMGKKVTNDTLAFARSIAETRGKNVADIEKMVTESVSFTAPEALKLNIIDAVVQSDDEVLPLIKKHFELDNATDFSEIELSFTDKLMNFLGDPDILAGLLMVGIFLMALEFKMPGTFIFAISGGVFLILFAVGSNIIPVNFFAFIFIFGAFALFFAEFFITSFGVLFILGSASLYFGLQMLFDKGENMNLGVSPLLSIGLIALFSLIFFMVGRLVMKDFKKKAVNGLDGMINQQAKVIEWSDRNGKVTLFGEIWDAESEQELHENDKVVIKGYNDMVLKVEKV